MDQGQRNVALQAAEVPMLEPDQLKKIFANAGEKQSPERRSQPSKCQYLFPFVYVRDIRHSRAEGPHGPHPRHRLDPLPVVAGFQVIIGGRFWVITEETLLREQNSWPRRSGELGPLWLISIVKTADPIGSGGGRSSEDGRVLGGEQDVEDGLVVDGVAVPAARVDLRIHGQADSMPSQSQEVGRLLAARHIGVRNV
jgi:hypothetical protein